MAERAGQKVVDKHMSAAQHGFARQCADFIKGLIAREPKDHIAVDFGQCFVAYVRGEIPFVNDGIDAVGRFQTHTRQHLRSNIGRAVNTQTAIP